MFNSTPSQPRRAASWAESLKQAGVAAIVVDGESTVGGGSLPGEMLPTRLVAIETTGGRSATGAAGRLAARLRENDPPVVARVDRGRVLLDPRTVAPGEESALLAALVAAAA
jgi:L-seryl-tRNA(Ser) seleniumtransferase